VKKWITGVVFACAGYAQPPVMTPEQIIAYLARDLRGVPFPGAASGISPEALNRARPAGEAVSVFQVQHHPPKQARQALARARKLIHAGRHAEAVSELDGAVQIDPAFGDAHQFLGVEYGRTGRLAEAAASFRRLLVLDPDNWRAHYNLGLALLLSGDFANAETSARRALQLAPTDPEANLLFGCALSVRPGMLTQAVPYVRFAARTMPSAKQLLRQIDRQ